MFRKLAFQVGVKIALETAGEELNNAAQQLYGIAGGLAGAVGGGFLGRYLGRETADAFDLDEDMSGAIGTGLGSLVGGGLGTAAGSNLATLARGQPGEVADTPAYEPEPEYPTVGLSILDQLPDEQGLGLMQPFYDVTPSYAPQDVFSMGAGNNEGGYEDYGYEDFSY